MTHSRLLCRKPYSAWCKSTEINKDSQIQRQEDGREVIKMSKYSKYSHLDLLCNSGSWPDSLFLQTGEEICAFFLGKQQRLRTVFGGSDSWFLHVTLCSHVHSVFKRKMEFHLAYWAAHWRSFRTRSHHRSRDHLPEAGNVPVNANNSNASDVCPDPQYSDAEQAPQQPQER